MIPENSPLLAPDAHGRLSHIRGRAERFWLKMKEIPQQQDLLRTGDPTARNDFYLKVAIVAVLLLGADLAYGWILQFYFGNQIIVNLSFMASDPSWIPAGTHFKAALGVHYFGDFEQYMGYARSHIPPYSPSIVYPAIYGPVAIILVKVLDDVFGWPGAVLVFLPATLVLFTWGMMRLLGSFLSGRLLALLLLFSCGVIVALDRGNLQILVATLCVWFCVGLLENRPWVLVVSLALAMALKLYVAVLILVLIRQHRWRETARVLLLSAGLYAVGFALLGGGFTENIRSFVHSNLLFASNPTKDFMLGCVSALAALYKVLYLSWGLQHFVAFLNHSPSWYIQIPGIVVGIVCLAIIWLSKRPLEIALVAALAMMQLAPTATYPYVDINTIIELALLMRMASTSRPASDEDADTRNLIADPPIARWILIGCIGLLLIASVPWFGIIHGRFGTGTPMSELVSPAASILVIILLLGGLIFGRLRSGRTPQSQAGYRAAARSEVLQPVATHAAVNSLTTSH